MAKIARGQGGWHKFMGFFLAMAALATVARRADAEAGARSAMGESVAAAMSVGRVLWCSVSPAAKDCPSAFELRKRVSERLGYDPFVDEPESSEVVQVSFSRRGELYRARLVLRDSGSNIASERQFEDATADCRQLGDAVVLGITLLLEGGAPNERVSRTAASSGVRDDGSAASPKNPTTASTTTPQTQDSGKATRNPTDPGDFPFVGARLGAKARMRLIGPLALSLGGTARMAFNRAVFRAEGLPEPVWSQPFWGLEAEVGLGLCFD